MIKKILVFEFITGGGYAQQVLPVSLANEGMLMLNALLLDLAVLSDIQITVMQDWRCTHLPLPKNAKAVLVSKGQSIDDLMQQLIECVDAVWLIAPETDAILSNLSQWVEAKLKILLNSSSAAVALCSDKLSTKQYLEQHAIPLVKTLQLDTFLQDFDAPWVVKAKDGVGCLENYYVSSQNGLNSINSQIKRSSDYIIQPYINDNSLSLSCLFKEGKAWLLCCNRQIISVQQGRFELSACEVNIAYSREAELQQLIDKVAIAIPGLWGYVGIDLVQTESGELLVLEINPRLTTSYAGIHSALGINVASLIIAMIDNKPMINKKINRQITVLIPKN